MIPLATLLGLGDRPGESHAFGPLDPSLCRQLAAAAAASPATSICLTVTDADGIAIGHGCARSSRRGHLQERHRQAAGPLPARLNLTVRVSDLSMLALSAEGPPGEPPWSFRYRHDPGPPAAFGTWTLTAPGGRELTLRLEPVPVFGCDHHHESHAYQPNDTLRHLVQLRDGDCTFPTCSRHARETDFEHAVPYHRGGRTCACNAGSRSRACHRVKQSPGWTVTQPMPGWHHREGPSGRGYIQGPKRYPA